ncbi:metal-dependent hydrolase [Cohnella phaseoli]|uniref:Inner membrane protein n=1 Tax=Cohnella phaseoli TaxID=456490 RepID=A0A3D9ITW7_9BACL|nr:metal-dependent hydrolase [Cohnella phaseoli]RED65188.1 inner membrane protein [Cohnella phaseoli]
MKGTTHLAIGCAIGAVACAYYPFSPNNAALFFSVAGLSALSADLDGPSILSRKITKLSQWLRNAMLVAGLLLMAGLAYVVVVPGRFDPVYAACAISAFLLGLVAKKGVIRNAIVSLIGGALFACGWVYGYAWLSGLGVFVAWAPWLKHRGMTHTIWALIGWGAIGWGLEQQSGVEGVTAVAIAGYASHLLTDTMTPSGVKWLYPLYKKPIKLR